MSNGRFISALTNFLFKILTDYYNNLLKIVMVSLFIEI